MGVELLIRYVTNALFVVIFVVVLTRALRQRNRVWVETTIFFGCAAFLVVDAWALFQTGLLPERPLDALNLSLIITMAFLLARLIDNMSVISPVIMRVASVGFVMLVVVSLASPTVDSPFVLLPALGYFGLLVVFAAVVMAAAGIRSSGATQRRMLSVALGSLLLCLTVVVTGMRAAFPHVNGISHNLINGPLALLAGLAYFVGFATPNFLRQSWQDRVLREFFERTMTLSRMSDLDEIVFGLETAARRSLGGSLVWLALWDQERDGLRFVTRGEAGPSLEAGNRVEEKVYSRQRSIVSTNLERDDPTNAAYYREHGFNAVICAPVSVREHRFGVIAMYAPRAPVFVDDDLMVVTLMANQAAIVLESHALITQTTRLRAREEATHLKNDFLAAAAHDLSNPLTAIVMQAQLIERRARRDPSSVPEPTAIRTLIEQAVRLQTFVADLLDVQRLEIQGITLMRSEVDFSELVEDAARRVPLDKHSLRLDLQKPLVINGDRARISRVVDNLLSNAMKYSPNGGEIVLRLWSDEVAANLVVRDHGIGIPSADLPFVFERFQRGGNTEGTELRGVGLGLFICRAILEAHGGSISVKSDVGRGSEFLVVLPIGREQPSDRASRHRLGLPDRVPETLPGPQASPIHDYPLVNGEAP